MIDDRGSDGGPEAAAEAAEPAGPAGPGPEPDEEVGPAPLPAPPVVLPTIPVVSARGLVAASFDLLGRSGEDMRRASFYIGTIVLGTVGPLALASWGIEVMALERSSAELAAIDEGPGGALLAVLGLLALVGLLVALIDSRTLAASILGGHTAGRPVTVRAALARSRRTFWPVAVASVLVAIGLRIVQAVIEALLGSALLQFEEIGLLISVLVTVTVGAPFAYVLAGIVLGDVDALESIKRSVRLFRARKAAAATVVAFEFVSALLVVLGITAGLDVVLRVFLALGLGPDAGPAGLALVTAGIVAIVFALGTLVYTVMAITVAPQVVMFVGLTHATLGLDRVRGGGAHDPDAVRAGRRGFSWLGRPMMAGFVLGGILLAGILAAFLDTGAPLGQPSDAAAADQGDSPPAPPG